MKKITALTALQTDHLTVLPIPSLFCEEVSACTAVHMYYVIDTCDHV